MGQGDGDSLWSDQENGVFARKRAIHSATVDHSWGANPSLSLGAVEPAFASDRNTCPAVAQHTDDFGGFVAAPSSSDLGVDGGIAASGGNLIRQVSGLPCFRGVDGDVARLQDPTAPLASNNRTPGHLCMADGRGISEENSGGKMPDRSDFDSRFSFGNIQTRQREEDVKRERSARNRGKAAPKQDKELSSEGDPPPKDEYIHLRAKRGHVTNSHSLAERVRRQKISERMKFLQDLVPGCSKMTGKAVMLDEIINYIQSLQRQVEFLSMKLATVNPGLHHPDVEVMLSDGARWMPGRQALHSQAEGGSDIFDLSHGFASSRTYVQGGSTRADVVAAEFLRRD